MVDLGELVVDADETFEEGPVRCCAVTGYHGQPGTGFAR